MYVVHHDISNIWCFLYSIYLFFETFSFFLKFGKKKAKTLTHLYASCNFHNFGRNYIIFTNRCYNSIHHSIFCGWNKYIYIILCDRSRHNTTADMILIVLLASLTCFGSLIQCHSKSNIYDLYTYYNRAKYKKMHY